MVAVSSAGTIRKADTGKKLVRINRYTQFLLPPEKCTEEYITALRQRVEKAQPPGESWDSTAYMTI